MLGYYQCVSLNHNETVRWWCGCLLKAEMTFYVFAVLTQLGTSIRYVWFMGMGPGFFGQNHSAAVEWSLLQNKPLTFLISLKFILLYFTKSRSLIHIFHIYLIKQSNSIHTITRENKWLYKDGYQTNQNSSSHLDKF